MTRYLQRGLASLLSCSVLLVGLGSRFGYAAEINNSQPAPQATQQSPEQLQQLVAPIALYPDSLIAQILPAATYPEQIVESEKWITQNGNLNGDNLAKAVDVQPWDASVKALTQFPAVLANMNQNLAWTSELGDAYMNQQQELSQAIQTMRARAKQAGNLNATPQQRVSTSGQTIVIQPAENDVVYVPQYDPWLAYGAPLAMFPGWYPWQACSSTVRVLNLDWVPEWVFSAVLDGAGTTGATIGITAEELYTTTTLIFRIARRSSTAIVFTPTEGISTTEAATRRFELSLARLIAQGCIRALSADSIMAVLREATPFGGSPVLVDSTEAVAASMAVVEDFTAAAAADSRSR